MRRVAGRREIKLESESWFRRRPVRRKGLLIARRARLFAVVADFLRQNLRQNKFPAHKSGEGQGALFDQIGQGAPDKFEQDGLRNVLLPRLALQPLA